MGRKLLNIPQEQFSFAITPKTDQDRLVVEQLNAMKETGDLSAWLRSLVYAALLSPGDKPTIPQNEARTGIVEHDTPKPAPKPALPHGAQSLPVGGWQTRAVPKPGSNGKRRNGASDTD